MGEAFEDAFALLKIREAMDPRAFMEENDAPGLDRLGEILNNGPEDYSANVFQDAILEQMLDPSNQYDLTDAKTPTLYRAEPMADYGKPHFPDQFRRGRFFSPQKLTAEQYSQYQTKNDRGPSYVHQYELPVPFDDESVLQVPTSKYGLSIRGDGFDIDDPEVARMAEGNDYSLEEALKAIKRWNSVYNGFTPRSNEQHLETTESFRNAGWDNIVWPETTSQYYYPPSAASAFGAIDWGAKHEAQYGNRKDVDKYWEPARNVLMEQLGIPERDSRQAMGKHSGFPQWANWHIGDEDSAPKYQSDKDPYLPDMKGKTRRTDYHNFSAAANIAEQSLGLGDRYDSI